MQESARHDGVAVLRGVLAALALGDVDDRTRGSASMANRRSDGWNLKLSAALVTGMLTQVVGVGPGGQPPEPEPATPLHTGRPATATRPVATGETKLTGVTGRSTQRRFTGDAAPGHSARLLAGNRGHDPVAYLHRGRRARARGLRRLLRQQRLPVGLRQARERQREQDGAARTLQCRHHSHWHCIHPVRWAFRHRAAEESGRGSGARGRRWPPSRRGVWRPILKGC
jgi:hypothetical protein